MIQQGILRETLTLPQLFRKRFWNGWEKAMWWGGNDSKRPPCANTSYQTIWTGSAVWRDTLLTSVFQRLLLFENTTLRRIPRLGRWHNANHELGGKKQSMCVASQPRGGLWKSGQVLSNQRVEALNPHQMRHTTNKGWLLNESQMKKCHFSKPTCKKNKQGELLHYTSLKYFSQDKRWSYKN